HRLQQKDPPALSPVWKSGIISTFWPKLFLYNERAFGAFQSCPDVWQRRALWLGTVEEAGAAPCFFLGDMGAGERDHFYSTGERRRRCRSMGDTVFCFFLRVDCFRSFVAWGEKYYPRGLGFFHGGSFFHRAMEFDEN